MTLKSQRSAQIKMTAHEKALKALDKEIGAILHRQREEGCSEELFNTIAKIESFDSIAKIVAQKAAIVQEMRTLDAKCREQFRVGLRSPTLSWLDSPTRALQQANID